MIELLRTRRSIRKFRDKPIDEKELSLLTEALLRSPTSRGLNPWEFIIVQDRQLIEQLSHAKKHGSAFLKEAVCAIVILGNEERSDVWIEDCSIAAIIVQLCGQSLGIGSCWVQIRNRPHDGATSAEIFVRNLLDIPHNLHVGMIIGLGYPDERKLSVPADQLPNDKLHKDKYSTKKERK